jgi:spermidine/putrescine ABC transporter ATP-binding subunit
MTGSIKTASTNGVSAEFDAVTKQFGDFLAVKSVSLRVEAGEFVSLLGASGSGKTTLLMMLAGFEACTSGRIRIGSRDVTALPANQRGLGVVFQRYALFPHMTIAENIAFPLRMRKMARAERDAEVKRVLDVVQLSGYDDRKPSQLSGGQQQRVALARAIVFRPQLILMDEPLGALDKKLRQHLQIEIKELQARLGATVVFVTHDQEEALTMSDRVAVVSQGEIVQYDAPETLYKSPKSPLVAGFIGEMNFFKGLVHEVAGDVVTVRVNGSLLAVARREQAPLRTGQAVTIAVRPQHLSLGSPDAPGLAGVVYEVVFSGLHRTAYARLEDGTVAKFNVEDGSVTSGTSVRLHFAAGDALIYAD